MNQAGLIDAVITEDSDALVFGAKIVIRVYVYFTHCDTHLLMSTQAQVEGLSAVLSHSIRAQELPGLSK